MNSVLVSCPLALAENDPLWVKLESISRVHVRPLSSQVPLIKDRRLAKAVGLITMIDDKIDSTFLRKAPQLKVIANHAVGFNNIDLTAASKRNIVVCNTPDVLTNATAGSRSALLSPRPKGLRPPPI